MNKALLWMVRIGHQSALHRLIARLAPIAERAWFPPLAGVLAFAATLSMSVPTVKYGLMAGLTARAVDQVSNVYAEPPALP